MTTPPISKAQLGRYSGLAIPIAFAGFPLYVLAPDYYATSHGVSLSLLGFLLLGLRLLDAIQDPLIGAYSDRYRHSSPAFMLIASIILCAGIYGLFNAMPLSPALWFTLCIACSVTAYSILSINLNSLGALWTNNPAAQTRITTWREACGLFGVVVAVALPGLLKHYVDQQQAYLYFSLILCAGMVLAWIAFWPWLTRNTPRTVPVKISQSLLAGVKSMPRATHRFMAVYALSMLASSIPAVLVIFFVRDLLGAENLTGIFLLLYFLTGALSMPLWRMASARFGNTRAWGLSMLLAVMSFIGAFFLGEGDYWHYAVICCVSGIALGADLALPPAILADHIHQSQSQQHAATQYALLAFAAKFSLALASAIALPLLARAGFVPAGENSKTALLFLSTSYALIPCVLKLLAAGALWRMGNDSTQGENHENRQANRHSGSSNHA